MELYILSKQDLSILSICKLADYQINLDEETNAKSTFTLMKTDGLKKDNFMVLNGLYRQFLFVIDEVNTEKGSDVVTVTALDISNIFDRKVIEKNTETMTSNSIEEFIANTMSENFVNSDDTALNVGYIDIYWHTNTQATVATNAENGLYNFHTFLINCRQYKNIYTDFKFEDGRLKITISHKEETIELIDTTLPEVTDYNKIYEEDVTAKVQVYIREDGSEYNLYLKTDRTTTTNKDDPDRASGKIEVISVETADKAPEEALNVMKGNNYKHLVEFKIAKTSKLMDITELHIGRPIRIKTDDDIYDSYISAITLSDENFVYFKSGSLRITLLDKLKKSNDSAGNKLDVTGGKILGNLNILDNAYFGKNGVSFGTPYDQNLGGSCQVDGSKVVGQDAISAKASRGNLTFTSMWTDVSVGNFSAQKIIGNKLSISDGKVKVGAGVKKVLAFAINDGFYVGTLSGDKCIHLQVNGSNVSDGSYYSSQQGGILPLFTSMSIIEVQENDLIGVSVMSGATGTLSILESYLYVQVVE